MLFSSNSVVLAALVAVARLLDDLPNARVHLPDGGVRPDRVLVLCEGSESQLPLYAVVRSHVLASKLVLFDESMQVMFSRTRQRKQDAP